MRSGKALGVGADAAGKPEFFAENTEGHSGSRANSLFWELLSGSGAVDRGQPAKPQDLAQDGKKKWFFYLLLKGRSGLVRRKAHQAQHMLVCSKLRLISDGLSLKQDFGSRAEIEVRPWQ